MKEQLAKIPFGGAGRLWAGQSAAELDSLRVQYLGKKGELTAVLKMMGKLSAEERPAMGQMANEVRSALEAAIEAASGKLEAPGPGATPEGRGGGCDHPRPRGEAGTQAPHVPGPG